MGDAARRGERVRRRDAMAATPLPPRFSLLRSLGPADFVTLLNACAGTAAILMCVRWAASGGRSAELAVGFVLLGVALAADVADGAVARRGDRASLLGPDLDSLADVVSFGVAPAVVGFVVGLDGAWDVVVLCLFVCGGASRLARFNVTREALSGGAGKVLYFEGTPIPSSLLIVAVLAVAWWRGAVGDAVWLGTVRLGPGVLHPLVLLYAASGAAMVSARLRIPKP
jgi:CDP-diacylglycerol--serine O-phosphatidyltransferase